MWPYKCSNTGKTPIFRDSIYEVKMAILKSSDPLVDPSACGQVQVVCLGI